MVVLTSHFLQVPRAKDKLYVYIEHVLRRIYELCTEDLWFIAEDATVGATHGSVKLEGRTQEFHEIEFVRCLFTPLVNILPETRRILGHSHYTNTERLSSVAERIREVTNNEDIMDPTEPEIEKDRLPDLIMQLALDEEIEKFFQLSPKSFLCVAHNVPLLISYSLRDEFTHGVSVCKAHGFTFDVEEGFKLSERFPLILSPLNRLYSAWEQAGDFSRDLIPANEV
jgi:hypothetical protein